MLNIFLLLFIFPLVTSFGDIVLNKICEFDAKQCYIKESLVAREHSANQLAVNVVSNTLYFSFDSGQGEYIPAAFNIDTKRLTILKGVKDAFAIASDPVNNEIYFGGSHGIYRYNPTLNSLKRLSVNNLDIWWIQVKSKIYFVKFPSLKMYVYEQKTVRPIVELKNSTVHQFVLDSDDNTFFVNRTGLFGLKKGTGEVIFLRDNPRFFGMASDNAGHVYLCNENGIYIINKILMRVKRVFTIQGVLGITFDKENNLIYSDSHEIVRLKPALKDDYYVDKVV